MNEAESTYFHSLPLIIQPTTSGELSELTDLITFDRDSLKRQLTHHGALLFRGFEVDSITDFSVVVDTLFPDLKSLSYTGGGSTREKITESVYTASEFPSGLRIQNHNEMSYMNKMPHYLFFYCLVPPKVGGETPITDSRGVLKSLDPKLRMRFEEKGVRYDRYFMDRGKSIFSALRKIKKTWQDSFDTEDKETVEELCNEIGLSVQWESNGNLSVTNVCPATRTHPETGETVWCNQAHVLKVVPENIGWTNSLINRLIDYVFFKGRRNQDVALGDGTEITRSDIGSICKAYRENTVMFTWQKGDILALDNYLVAHGRMPFEGPRKILVTMR